MFFTVFNTIWTYLTKPHIWLVTALVAKAFETVLPPHLQPYAQAAQDAATGISALTMQWMKDMAA